MYADDDFKLLDDSVMSYGVQNEINKAYIASKGTTMPEGMKESFPRISPYVKQLDMDVKAELHDATEQMVKKWKKESKVTGGRILDEKSVKKQLKQVIKATGGDISNKEVNARLQMALEGFQNAWYEINNHEEPDLDVVEEVVNRTADAVIGDKISYGEDAFENSEKNAVKKALQDLHYEAQRYIKDPKTGKFVLNDAPFSYHRSTEGRKANE